MSSTPRPAIAPRHRFAILAASLVIAQVAGAAPVSAQPKGPAAPADNSKQAFETFKKAQALYKGNKFADALPLFRESYSLQPSPNSQVYIARCLAGMGDYVAAYIEFGALIADVDKRNDPKYADAREVAVNERTETATKIALLTVTVTNPTTATLLSVGGRDIPRESWGQPIPLAPGAIDVVVSTAPAAPQSKHLDLQAGEKKDLSLDAAPPAIGPQTPPPSTSGSRAILRPIAYLAGGIGVAGFVMFGVTGGLSSAAYADLDKKCSKGSAGRICPDSVKDEIASGKLEKDLANAGLIIGAAGLAAGVTLFILSRDTGPKKEATPAPEVHAIVSPAYLGLQGTF